MSTRLGGSRGACDVCGNGIATVQGATRAAVLIGCGALVLYPVPLLVLEPFNTGDSTTSARVHLGHANCLDLFNGLGIVRNTGGVCDEVHAHRLRARLDPVAAGGG